jgi:Ni,Fe-hydrogenase III small subunit
MLPDLARDLFRRPVADPVGAPDLEIAGALAAQLDSAAQARLGRSLAILHVSAGGCGGCAMEIGALQGIPYGLERYGLTFVGSPRHADVLLATGPLTFAMRAAMESVWTAMPEPRWVVAVGACAVDGGLFAGSYAVPGGIGTALPVDLVVEGCPPSPASVLEALLTLIEANR